MSHSILGLMWLLEHCFFLPLKQYWHVLQALRLDWTASYSFLVQSSLPLFLKYLNIQLSVTLLLSRLLVVSISFQYCGLCISWPPVLKWGHTPVCLCYPFLCDYNLDLSMNCNCMLQAFYSTITSCGSIVLSQPQQFFDHTGSDCIDPVSFSETLSLLMGHPSFLNLNLLICHGYSLHSLVFLPFPTFCPGTCLVKPSPGLSQLPAWFPFVLHQLNLAGKHAASWVSLYIQGSDLGGP